MNKLVKRLLFSIYTQLNLYLSRDGGKLNKKTGKEFGKFNTHSIVKLPILDREDKGFEEDRNGLFLNLKCHLGPPQLLN